MDQAAMRRRRRQDGEAKGDRGRDEAPRCPGCVSAGDGAGWLLWALTDLL